MHKHMTSAELQVRRAQDKTKKIGEIVASQSDHLSRAATPSIKALSYKANEDSNPNFHLVSNRVRMDSWAVTVGLSARMT
jgi:hypothetical protein